MTIPNENHDPSITHLIKGGSVNAASYVIDTAFAYYLISEEDKRCRCCRCIDLLDYKLQILMHERSSKKRGAPDHAN
jgi:hypothetical protein